jgi:hypothetical protein
MTPEQRLKRMPVSCQATYKAALAGRSRAKGVKAFCQMCMGYERKLVRNCTDLGCPLYPYRPYQTKDPLEEEESTESILTTPKKVVKKTRKKLSSKKVKKKRSFRRTTKVGK